VGDDAGATEVRKLAQRIGVVLVGAKDLLGEAGDRLCPGLDDAMQSKIGGRSFQHGNQAAGESLVRRLDLAVALNLGTVPVERSG
jgi:hypothetical protein